MRKLFFIGLVFLVSCQNPEPKNLLSPEKMQDVLWDVVRAQSLATTLGKNDSTLKVDAEIKVLSEKVFEIHHISEQTFNDSYNWYIAHPEVFQKILDSLQSRKQKQNIEEYQKEPEPILLKEPIKIRRKKPIENE